MAVTYEKTFEIEIINELSASVYNRVLNYVLNHELNKNDSQLLEVNLLNQLKLAKRVKFFKEDKEGVKIMSNVFEEIKNEGAETRAYEIARSLITLGVDDDKILQSTKLSKHVFEKLKKEVKEESDNLKAV